MATLDVQDAQVQGATLTFASASGGGDAVSARGGVFLLVRNADASPKTVTLVRPGTEFGVAVPDVPFAVAAGTTALLGPIPSDFTDPDTGLVGITYSAVTSVTVAAFRA